MKKKSRTPEKPSRIPVMLTDKDLHQKMKTVAAYNGVTVPEMIETAERYFLKEKCESLLDTIIKV